MENNSKRKPLLILFEGGEGAGKSTAIDFISPRLREAGYGVVVTKEPGCEITRCQEIRKILLDPDRKLSPEEELALFMEDRSEHFRKIIIPALQEGKIVLCDRSSPSTIAYQHYARGLDLKEILEKDEAARQGVGFDIVLLFDLDSLTGLRRKKEPETRFEKEKIDFHQKVREGYLAQAASGKGKWVVINASAPKEEVAEKVWETIRPLLD